MTFLIILSSFAQLYSLNYIDLGGFPFLIVVNLPGYSFSVPAPDPLDSDGRSAA
jgi:hypothetical protein